MGGLVGLTFGEDNPRAGGNTQIVKPSQGTGVLGTAKVKVIKVEQFFGTKETYVIGELVEGTISKNITTEFNGKMGEIIEIKYK